MKCRTIKVPVYGEVFFSEEGIVERVGLTQEVEVCFSSGNPFHTSEVEGGEELAVKIAKQILKNELGELPGNLEFKASPSSWGCYQPAFAIQFRW